MVFLRDTKHRRPRMADSIAATVERIKRDPSNVLDRTRVHGICRELGHDWRERELDPATTVALFLQQVLHGNCPCSEVRHLPGGAGNGRSFTASAYCDGAQTPAAGRLPGDAHRGGRRGTAGHVA